MRFPGRTFALVAVLWLTSFAAAQPVTEGGPVQLRIKRGDDPRWAAADFDDRDWPVMKVDERNGDFHAPTHAGVFWLRFRVARGCADVPGNQGIVYTFAWPKDAKIDGIFFAAVASFELYWDGKLLERSGVVGPNPAEEIPGPLDHLIPLPEAGRGPGEHVVALRMSSEHFNFRGETGFYPGFLLVNCIAQQKAYDRKAIFPLLGLVGALVMAAAGSVLLRAAERRRTLLLCNVFSLLLAFFYGLVALRWLYNAPYDWSAPRMQVVTFTMAVLGLLLPWILLEQFAAPKRGRWVAVLGLLLVGTLWLAPRYYEPKAFWFCRAMLLFSSVVAGWAVWRRRPGARVVLASMLVALLIVQSVPPVYVDPMYFVVFEGLMLAVFAAHGAQVLDDRRRVREAAVASARMELELLKKNIQPHFVLNTLGALIETIEQEPKTAVTLIEGLAGEFRTLARAAGERLIPLAHELELCRSHLRIMSLRKEVACTLALEGEVNGRALIPPALFHTLIENGVTHLAPRDGALRFRLGATRLAGRVRYTLVAEGNPIERAPADAAPRPEGTGLRYIKARLEESFPGNWNFHGGPVPEGWRTEIEFPHVGESAAVAPAVVTSVTATEGARA